MGNSRSSPTTPARGVGRAFSIHTFSGMFGSAAAPVGMVFLASLMGWLPRSTTARGGAIRLRPQAQGNRQSVQRPKIYCLLALQERMMPFALMQQVVDFVGPHT